MFDSSFAFIKLKANDFFRFVAFCDFRSFIETSAERPAEAKTEARHGHEVLNAKRSGTRAFPFIGSDVNGNKKC